MRYILCVITITAVALLLASVNATEEDEEQAKNMLRQMAADCINKTSATSEDVDGMCNKEPPKTYTGKCLAFCMMNQFNCINENGEFQKEEFMDLMSMATDNKTMLEMCDKVSTECKDTKDPNNDNCETAAMLLDCMDKGAKKYGFDKM